MLRVYSDVIQFRGNHYDFGYMQGELLRDSFILTNRQKQWFSKRNHHFIINLNEYKQAIQSIAPKIWDELCGLADSLKMNIKDAIRKFGGYYLEHIKSGCTIFTGSNYMIRNYDNDPLSYEGRYLIYLPTDGNLATIGPSMQITGRTDGINEAGLAMGYNFINSKQSADGFLCNMIGRIILETCKTVDDAISLLKEIPHRHSFSYVLLDPNSETYIIEASPRSVKIRSAQICANHFETLTNENRYRTNDSVRRVSTILKHKHKLSDSLAAYRMMNDSDRGIFSTNYGAWSGTLHTAIYYPEQLKAGFTLGSDRLPFIFDFKKWLHGDNFNVKRINGQLDTHIPFAHMTKL